MNAVYIYQTIHTLRGTALLPHAHVRALDSAARALFGRPFALPVGEFAARVGAVAGEAGGGDDLSFFVRAELAPDGRLTLRPAGRSLYRGHDLRSLMPEALLFTYDLPFGDYPTSASEAFDALARIEALRQGARCPLRRGSDGAVRTGDGAPLFAVRGDTVITTPGEPGAERTAAAASIAAAGLRLEERPLAASELARCDELFCFDHRGLLSISRCGGISYPSLTAERVARAACGLTEEFRKM